MRRMMVCRAVLVCLIVVGVGALSVAGAAEAGSTDSEGLRWYRGNTHTHTVLCGHADSSPEAVTKWYHDHGYHFLILSEHNQFIDPKSVTMPEGLRDDFLLIPGEEVTGKVVVKPRRKLGKRAGKPTRINTRIHSTAMNVDRLVPWTFETPGNDPGMRTRQLQQQVDQTEEAHGVSILNHPVWRKTLTAAEILPVKNLFMFELFNESWEVRDLPDDDPEYPIEEVLWDRLLTQGMTMFGVAADDAHKFKEFDFSKSNPGRGWVMVRSAVLSGDAITAAMWRGEFYSSTGVYLEKYVGTRAGFDVRVDEQATAKELALPIVRQGRMVLDTPTGYTISLIGEGGKTLKTVRGSSARFAFPDTGSYARIKVSFFRESEGSQVEGFYAWCQPVFRDASRVTGRVPQHDYLESQTTP